MDPRLILFDVDGTLIDSAGAGRAAMERACRRVFQVDGVSELAAGVRFAGMTDPVILEAVARAVGIAPARYERERDELERAFLHELRVELERPEPRRRVLPGVRELLDELTGREGIWLGLLTGNLEPGAWAKLTTLGLGDYFRGGGFSSDHADRREIARLARLKLSAATGIAFASSRVVVVGDTEHDVDCARANGFRSVAVASGWVPRDRLEQAAPDALLDDFTDRSSTFAALGLD